VESDNKVVFRFCFSFIIFLYLLSVSDQLSTVQTQYYWSFTCWCAIKKLFTFSLC